MDETNKKSYGEKECEICGKLFTVTNPLQKYCPECRDSSGSKKRKMDRIYAGNSRKYMSWEIEDHPREIDNICPNCGKHFMTYRRSRTYCSNKCEREYHLSHTFCLGCGKPQSETDDKADHYGRGWCCSPECELIYARKVGRAKICPVCGKEFADNSKDNIRKYCSTGCASKGNAIERRKKKELEERIEETGESVCDECGKKYKLNRNAFFQFNHYCSIECRRKHYEKTGTGTMEQCPVCGKDFFCSVNEPHIYGFGNVCSEECAQKALSINRKKAAEDKAKAEQARVQEEKEREERKAEREKRKAEIEKAKKEGKKVSRPAKQKRRAEDLDQKWVKENGLCGICKTSYKDCSLMQTEFRVKPDGAKYVNSKIVKCPLFR